MNRLVLLFVSASALGFAALAQAPAIYDDPDAIRSDLAQALAEQRRAELRSARYARVADTAETEAESAARAAAAVAAQIQQAEAGIAVANARIELVDRERLALRERIGREQQPIMRLTAALQQISRRPVALAMLRPGSVRDIVYLRALLHDAAPQVRDRTAGLRAEIARGQELRRQAIAARRSLRTEEETLTARRRELAVIETRQRLEARAAGGTANREAERALALAEQMRDLDGLVGEIDRAAALRERLAALPGPQMRPANLASATRAATLAEEPAARDVPAERPAPAPYFLPVTGRTVAGFGSNAGNVTSQGLTIAPLPGAQVVAPAAGRIVFAGPYRGYGQIVIIEHPGGWTSLVTGMVRADAQVGDMVEGGAPLGIAPPTRPAITLELRRDGTPVNPLPYMR